MIPFEEVFSEADQIGGATNVRELECLYDLALDATVIVELGCDYGRSTLVLSRAKKEFYTVDNFCYNDENNFGVDHREEFFNNKKKYSIGVGLLEGDTVEMAKHLDKDIDLLFVDAGHTAEDVKGDIKAWLPKVVEGGFVAFHDYTNPSFPEYTAQIDKMMKDHTKINHIDGLVVFKIG